jgi:hypothetical protein
VAPRGGILPRSPRASSGRDAVIARDVGWVSSAPGAEFVRAGRRVRLIVGRRVRSGAAPRSFAPGVGFVRRRAWLSRDGDRKSSYLFVIESILDNERSPCRGDRVRSRRRLGSVGAGIEFVRAGLRVRLVLVVEFVWERGPTENCSTFGSFGSGEDDRRGPPPAPARFDRDLAQNTIGFDPSRRREGPARPRGHLAQIAIGFISPRASSVRSARGASLRSPPHSVCQRSRGHDGLSISSGRSRRTSWLSPPSGLKNLALAAPLVFLTRTGVAVRRNPRPPGRASDGVQLSGDAAPSRASCGFAARTGQPSGPPCGSWHGRPGPARAGIVAIPRGASTVIGAITSGKIRMRTLLPYHMH